MKSQGIALYPFVPSGSSFALSIDFFAELGFENVETKPDGHTVWQLPLEGREPLRNFIKKV